MKNYAGNIKEYVEGSGIWKNCGRGFENVGGGVHKDLRKGETENVYGYIKKFEKVCEDEGEGER